MSVLEFRPKQDEDEESGGWLSGPAHCIACQHKWVAVAPAGTVWLECPECASDRGIYDGVCLPSDGVIWRCACGSEVFYCTPDGVHCYSCGTEQIFRD